jgi:hypothetical protein
VPAARIVSGQPQLMTISHTKYIRLIIGSPILLMGIFVTWLQRRRAKENAEISSVERHPPSNGLAVEAGRSGAISCGALQSWPQ